VVFFFASSALPAAAVTRAWCRTTPQLMLLDARKIHPRGRELPLRPRGCPEGRTAAEPEKKKRDLGCEQNNRKLESSAQRAVPNVVSALTVGLSRVSFDESLDA